MPTRDPFYTSKAWRDLRPRILDRDGWECQVRVVGVCVGSATQVDHIVPRSVAPDLALDPSNLRASCGPCNQHLGGKLGRSRSSSSPPRASGRHVRVIGDGYGAW